ncbi:acyl-CoA dehydrogenase [Gordonia sp. (in: high G+C Gram-positive bacteria)]|uniref:acyl-CoA dehydrogenase family protein n=1 Tax=Gordonia sp. (in: high G+C Gram-positive bacteria) TaxID=84139 RepID=UPI00199D879F|nr:acyl-CoA dehydrogenase [Gordonia sp. (in: high G+C Gram-positive bacteria)]MBD0020664.1 acyl-CoA dehydrogenase family protein [Gordonia sp. (in: high G+C Gram-positive bacteria)]
MSAPVAPDSTDLDSTDTLTGVLRTVLDGQWHETRDSVRQNIDRVDLLPDPSHTLDQARGRILATMRDLAAQGFAAPGFAEGHGGTGDVGAAVTGIETLGYADLSLMVKSGVQWGLFGGAVENLGTARHHEKYVPGIISLDVLGCFAMTETGHGSNVASLETTATYDPATAEFVIHSPTPSARKDYIGGAAEHARVAAVFAQLITGGPDEEPEGRGVHCFVVPIRDDDGHDLPGVITSDCGHKGGLAGVDNGRILFDNVRIPAENLLNRYGDVAADGTYSSPIESTNKRFFTMLGTLIRGRVCVAATSGAAARKALTLATRYGLLRRQFDAPDEQGEVTILDYLGHQRTLLPLIAKSYAIAFAQNDITARLTEADPDGARRLEADVAGFKAYSTWHASNAVNVAREACGGAGYLAENQLSIIRGDIDVFTTFEGDNTVLYQLVGKELLGAYAEDMRGLSARGWVRFVATMARDVVAEKTAVRQVIQTFLDDSDENPEDSNLTNRGTQIRLFRNREDHLLRTCAQRLRKSSSDEDAFEVFNNAQDHLLKVGQVHTERVILESMIAAIAECEERAGDGTEGATVAREVLWKVCDLFVYSALEADLGWFLMHRHVSVERAKAIRRGVNDLCADLRPHARALVDAFGIPESLLTSPMLDHG